MRLSSLLGLDLLVGLDGLDVLVLVKALDMALGEDGPVVESCISSCLLL